MTRALCCLILLLSACKRPTDGPGDDDAGGDVLAGLVALSISPADATLVIDQGVPATGAYVATGTFDDGREIDVTAHVTFTLEDGTLGGFAGNALTSTTTHGGQTNVRASARGIDGVTGLTLRLVHAYVDPASVLPSDPAGLFGGGIDATRAPSLVYPTDGVVVPPNLGKLELHFRPGMNNTVFELSMQSPLLDLKVFLSCTQPLDGGCIYLPDSTVWSFLANTNRGGTPVAWLIRGTDATGSAVGVSGAMSVAFTQQDVTGGIYYWTTTLQAIMRFDFASTTQTVAQKYVGSEATNGDCMGCHALSRDGTKMIAQSGGQNAGRLLLLDVATKQPLVPYASTAASIFETWAPDGSVFVGVYGDAQATNYNLMVFDGTTGVVVDTIDVGGTQEHPSNHPDWSPLGDRIVFTNVGIRNTLQKCFNSEIRTVVKASGQWQAPQLLVPRAPSKNRYYPSWAPDGRLVVFNESTCTNGNTGTDCDGSDDPTARLYAIDGLSGGAITELARANAPGLTDGGATNLTNSFPKWNPTVFSRTRDGGRVAWMTFSSTRNYGLRRTTDGLKLWMVAIDLDAPAGTDPSSPAFALPFQDLATSNHIAQWTTAIVGPIN